MSPLCHNEEIRITCFGCCAKRMLDREAVLNSLLLNTKEFKEIKNTKTFMDRNAGCTRDSGVCVNLIFLAKSRIGCPGHPKLNKGKDLRIGLRTTYCNPDYMCDAASRFNQWDSETQKKFIEFLKSRKLDWYSYSKGMDNNSFLKEFLL
jgi:hypothetical protein